MTIQRIDIHHHFVPDFYANGTFQGPVHLPLT